MKLHSLQNYIIHLVTFHDRSKSYDLLSGLKATGKEKKKNLNELS